MKPDYTLLKRSKVDVNRFAFVYDGDLLANFTASQLYRTLEKLNSPNVIKDVDVLWRDGTRTVEELRVTEHRHFVRFDTCEYDHAICLMMRAQGLPIELSVPVDVRRLFDAHGSLISEIRVPSEFVADLKPALERFIPGDEDDWDEDADDDFDDEDESDFDEEEFGFRPEDLRPQLSDFGYRAADWVVTLTDEQISEVHTLEVGIDPDIELPRAADAKEEFF
ncbi:hypothetical protein HOT49_gp321 [Erwinia phage vB_EamM_Alexandra]|uniref:Uncharacterized protein n=1 Tax=Erwinia phage vB_EamM_Alexandra TaxID=2201424 RepID=A0A2Z4QFS2_9CAUD|nr:hypothetical protein HOT49_gp321 [Erwinia phage vB_EamM_Alexandra]AWY08576.1 hypothetical protein Alexandra_325 [Erwinia phage vB_EamM_Alexandra]